MENIQENLFNQSENKGENDPHARPADLARRELAPEVAELKRLKKATEDRYAQKAITERQEQIDRALEQGVDLRTLTEIKRENDRRGLDAVRKALDEATPPFDMHQE